MGDVYLLEQHNFGGHQVIKQSCTQTTFVSFLYCFNKRTTTAFIVGRLNLCPDSFDKKACLPIAAARPIGSVHVLCLIHDSDIEV